MKPNFDNETNNHKLFQFFMYAYFLGTEVKVFTEHRASAGVSYIDVVVVFDNSSLSDKQIEAIRRLLPDGMNDLTELHWVFELKATESCNEDGRDQLFSNVYLYRNYQKMARENVAGILICLHVPQHDQLAKMGFTRNPAPGVYRSDSIGFEHLTLIAVSKLTDDTHNVFLRFFSYQEKVHQSAEHRLKTDSSVYWNPNLELLFLGYQQLKHKYLTEDWDMSKFQTMTAEEVIEEGKEHIFTFLHRAPLEMQAYFLQDLPFVHNIEIQAKQEGEAKGETKARTQFQQEQAQRLRSKILDKLQLRFNISDTDVNNVLSLLHQQDLTALETLFEAALLSESFADFCTQLEQ